MELFRLNGVVVNEGDALVKDLGLTSARWKVLGAVNLAEAPLTVPQIAHRMGQTRQGVQRLTDAMVKEGLLMYSDNPMHKRAKLVSLTDKGKETVRKTEEIQIPWANELGANFTGEELKTVLDVLTRMEGLFRQG
ncbi:MarR family winged helix-turn-helix transcriptional regulator [Limisalsivibrio acetivorans]|uniref:MarR family winged helix-turn-helix transcriptional regulator n=1 Tax=Limisalsivibrio acetivorans TaxID=1304888 RepID=UPI00192E64FC|nr:MarR family transcriptional regulator [Limisalsivibrio acetivorans]